MRVANLLGRHRLQKFKKPIAKKMIKTIGRRGTNPETSSGQVLTLERGRRWMSEEGTIC